MSNKKFLRRDTNRFSRLGKNRKKLQKWRRPKGRDNKMRLKRRGYPSVVKIGYKKKKTERKKPFFVIRNLKDLEKIKKEKKAILGKIGAKKRIEIIKKAQEMKIKIQNVGGMNKNES